MGIQRTKQMLVKPALLVSKDLFIYIIYSKMPVQAFDLFGRVLGCVVSLQLEKITKVEHLQGRTSSRWLF